MGNKTPSRSKSGCPKEMNTTTVFKQEQPQTWCCCCEKQVSYRIPALVYVSDEQTFLAFAEKRKTLNDTSAEVLVMRRGTWVDAKTKQVEVFKNFEILLLLTLEFAIKPWLLNFVLLILYMRDNVLPDGYV